MNSERAIGITSSPTGWERGVAAKGGRALGTNAPRCAQSFLRVERLWILKTRFTAYLSAVVSLAWGARAMPKSSSTLRRRYSKISSKRGRTSSLWMTPSISGCLSA